MKQLLLLAVLFAAGTAYAQTKEKKAAKTRFSHPERTTPQPAAIYIPSVDTKEPEPPKPVTECPPLPFHSKPNSQLMTGQAGSTGFDPIVTRHTGSGYEPVNPQSDGYYHLNLQHNINQRIISFGWKTPLLDRDGELVDIVRIPEGLPRSGCPVNFRGQVENGNTTIYIWKAVFSTISGPGCHGVWRPYTKDARNYVENPVIHSNNQYPINSQLFEEGDYLFKLVRCGSWKALKVRL